MERPQPRQPSTTGATLLASRVASADDDDSVSTTSTVPETWPDDEEFDVERVLAQETQAGQTFYLLLWKNYPLEEATWEPKAQLSDLTLRGWEEQQQLEQSGLATPFDVAAFKARAQQKWEDTQERHRRREAKRARQRGSSSHRRPAGQSASSRAARLGEVPKARRAAVATSSNDDDDDDDDDIPLSTVQSRRAQGARDGPGESAGVSRRVPPATVPPATVPPAVIPSSRKAGNVRGDSKTRGGSQARRGGAASGYRNVFQSRGPPARAKKPNLLESASNANPKQSLFTKASVRRKAELAGRRLEDAAPDISAIPGGLFDPSKPLAPLRAQATAKTGQSDLFVYESDDNGDGTAPSRPKVPTPAIDRERPKESIVKHPTRGKVDAICYFWHTTGACSRRSDCDFMHTNDPKVRKGLDPRHDSTRPSNKPSPFSSVHSTVCYYWHTTGGCTKGEKCRYIHALDPSLHVAPSPHRGASDDHWEPSQSHQAEYGRDLRHHHDSSRPSAPTRNAHVVSPRVSSKDSTSRQDASRPSMPAENFNIPSLLSRTPQIQGTVQIAQRRAFSGKNSIAILPGDKIEVRKVFSDGTCNGKNLTTGFLGMFSEDIFREPEPKPVHNLQEHLAKSVQEVCFFWRTEGCTKKFDCPFVHSFELCLPLAPKPSSRSQPRKPKQTLCFYDNYPGGCNRGNTCPYIHEQGQNRASSNTQRSLREDPTALRPLEKSSRADLDTLDTTSKVSQPLSTYTSVNINRSGSASDPSLSIISDMAQPLLSPANSNRSDLARVQPPLPSVNTHIPEPGEDQPGPPVAKLVECSPSVGPEQQQADLATSSSDASKVQQKFRMNISRKKDNQKLGESLAKEVFFGTAESRAILLSFETMPSNLPCSAIFDATRELHFEYMSVAQDIELKQKEVLRQIHYEGNVGESLLDQAGNDVLDMLIVYLRLHSAGLVCTLGLFSVLIYPPMMEEWKFANPASPTSPFQRLRYIVFEADVQLVAFRGPGDLHLPEIEEEKSSRKVATTSAILGLDYKTLNEYRIVRGKASPAKYFFLLFPSNAGSTAKLVIQWLQACQPGCKLFSSQTPGSWDQFIRTSKSKQDSSVVVVHQSAIEASVDLPGVRTRLRSSNISFWVVADLGSKATIGTLPALLFPPDTGALFLTPNYCVADPHGTLALLRGFKKKLEHKSTVPGSYKLVSCCNLGDFLLDLAIEKANERSEFMDAHKDDAAADAKAKGMGLSWEDCDARFKCQHTLVDMMEDGVDDLFHLDEDSNPLVMADPYISSEDEPALLEWFNEWTIRNCHRYRLLAIIGTGERNFKRVTSRKTVEDGSEKLANPASRTSESPVEAGSPFQFAMPARRGTASGRDSVHESPAPSSRHGSRRASSSSAHSAAGRSTLPSEHAKSDLLPRPGPYKQAGGSPVTFRRDSSASVTDQMDIDQQLLSTIEPSQSSPSLREDSRPESTSTLKWYYRYSHSAEGKIWEHINVQEKNFIFELFGLPK